MNVLHLAIYSLITSLSSFAFLFVAMDYLELAVKVTIFVAAFIVGLGSYFAFDHYIETKRLGMKKPEDVNPNDPIYGELVAPCRCVYPHCCFCTADQKARRDKTLDE